jgi:hypothetical protein
MDDEIKKRYILRLTDVNVSDHKSAEDELEERLLEGVDKPVLDQEYERLPAEFTGLDDWPSSTNLKCWECKGTFAGAPKFIPTHIRTDPDRPKRYIFTTKGVFATFPQAARWILDHKTGEERDADLDRLRIVYQMFTGLRVPFISPAPSVYELVEYGGSMSTDEYWQKICEIDPTAGAALFNLPRLSPTTGALLKMMSEPAGSPNRSGKLPLPKPDAKEVMRKTPTSKDSSAAEARTPDTPMKLNSFPSIETLSTLSSTFSLDFE